MKLRKIVSFCLLKIENNRKTAIKIFVRHAHSNSADNIDVELTHITLG